jgi:hypothetical protein
MGRMSFVLFFVFFFTRGFFYTLQSKHLPIIINQNCMLIYGIYVCKGIKLWKWPKLFMNGMGQKEINFTQTFPTVVKSCTRNYRFH